MRRVECGQSIFTIAEARKRIVGQTEDVLGKAEKLAEISTEESRAAIDESIGALAGRS